MLPSRTQPSFVRYRQQQGAALYIALIMLILLALIGIIGMQVAGLQEKMAANYRSSNLAFQRAESLARSTENAVRAALFSSAGTYAASQEDCTLPFDPSTWANGLAVTVSRAAYVRRMDKCVPFTSLGQGGKVNEEVSNMYEITALEGARDSDTSASAVVNTIYIP